jgi:hypothetical protein
VLVLVLFPSPQESRNGKMSNSETLFKIACILALYIWRQSIW